jgi:hypothetical protein
VILTTNILLEIRNTHNLALRELSLSRSHGQGIIISACAAGDVVSSTAVVGCLGGGRVVVRVAVESELYATFAGAGC